MSADPTNALERRYRRLLAVYPKRYRVERGDELVGTLLDCAPPNRKRPTLAERTDLVRGGLAARIHGSRALGASGGWLDAAAIASVVLPALLASALVFPAVLLLPGGRVDAAHELDPLGPPFLWLLATLLVVGVAGFARRWSVAASGSAVLAFATQVWLDLSHEHSLFRPRLGFMMGMVAVGLLASRTVAERRTVMVDRRGGPILRLVLASSSLILGVAVTTVVRFDHQPFLFMVLPLLTFVIDNLRTARRRSLEVRFLALVGTVLLAPSLLGLSLFDGVRAPGGMWAALGETALLLVGWLVAVALSVGIDGLISRRADRSHTP